MAIPPSSSAFRVLDGYGRDSAQVSVAVLSIMRISKPLLRTQLPGAVRQVLDTLFTEGPGDPQLWRETWLSPPVAAADDLSDCSSDGADARLEWERASSACSSVSMSSSCRSTGSLGGE